MPRRFPVVISVLVLTSFLVAPTLSGQEATRAAPKPLDGLDTYIEKAMERWQIPGLAIAIVRDDKVVYSKGFGVRELGKPEKVTDQTLFAMASQSKAFTATALGLLVAEGKLRWDDRVIDHLPWFRMRDPYVTRELTVRDLLCHRCGLGTWQGDLMWYGSKLDRREVLERVRFLEPISSFRARYGYCNLAFVAAGEIIPTIAGASWEEFLKERLFEPLKMPRTNTDLDALAHLDDVARPHTLVKGKIVPVAYRATRNTAPAGAINSCVRDWARWLRLQLGRGKIDGDQIVPTAIIDETRTPQMLMPARSEGDRIPFHAYGLGWGLREYEGHRLISHGGGLDGMLSLSVIVPEEKLGVVVLTNYDEQDFYQELPLHVVDAYLGLSHPEREEKMLAARRSRDREIENEKKRPEHPGRPGLELSGYAGIYKHPVLGRATITEEDGKLSIAIEKNPGLSGTLTHWRLDTFRAEWADPYMRSSLLPFRLDEDGRAVEFRMKVRPDFVDPMEYRMIRTP